MSVLIAFTGPAGCGKNAAAKIICDGYGFTEASFARAMKNGAKTMLGLTENQVNGDGKDIVLERFGFTPRHVLQTLGTEWGRNLHPDIWITKVAELWEKIKLAKGNMVITDLRHENCAGWVRANGGTVVHICSSGLINIAENGHSSENGIHTDQRNGDIIIDNPIDEDRERGLQVLALVIEDMMCEINYRYGKGAPTEELTHIVSLQNMIASWADDVFPGRTITNALTKLVMEEIPEYLISQHDPMELADCAILIYDIAHLAGIDLEKAMKDKMAINKKRTWEHDENTGLMNHVKNVDKVEGAHTRAAGGFMKGDES